MGKFPVSKSKELELAAWMEELGIVEEDLEEKFIRGSGKGGQKINKSSHCVWLKHAPSGFEVKCQEDRSRAMNRFFARRILCAKIERDRLGKASAAEQLREKIRRQKRKRSKRAKAKVLDDKRKHADKKTLRKKVSSSE
ncbi:MAG: peptide chain release factor-like protein [Bdellovibrionales bacterium]|nr:peptide chain release factor-like protein [Bdellovibrionales bacterium]